MLARERQGSDSGEEEEEELERRKEGQRTPTNADTTAGD